MLECRPGVSKLFSLFPSIPSFKTTFILTYLSFVHQNMLVPVLPPPPPPPPPHLLDISHNSSRWRLHLNSLQTAEATPCWTTKRTLKMYHLRRGGKVRWEKMRQDQVMINTWYTLYMTHTQSVLFVLHITQADCIVYCISFKIRGYGDTSAHLSVVVVSDVHGKGTAWSTILSQTAIGI